MSLHLLKSQASNLVKFLEYVSRCPLLREKNSQFVKGAILRYERLWLPLLGAHKGERCLSAPLDIEWVWMCHMLSPYYYQKDCMSILGFVPSHTVPSPKDYSKNISKSEAIWRAMYTEPAQPFSVNAESDSIQGNFNQSDLQTSAITYNLFEAIDRQKHFFYQVSLPHYKDDIFISTAVDRYHKFLKLKSSNSDLIVVPCYDIDLVWHAHQNLPDKYKEDTENILGKMLNHDDNIRNRSADSILTNAFKDTSSRWREKYNEQYSTFGGMYRGEHPEGSLYEMTSHDVYATYTKKITLNFEHIDLEGCPNTKGEFELRISKEPRSNDSFGKCA